MAPLIAREQTVEQVVIPQGPQPPYFGRDSSRIVTGLLRPNVISVKCGAADDLGMADAVDFPGLVKSFDLVVGDADPGERR
jgi:hypothetical protein